MSPTDGPPPRRRPCARTRQTLDEMTSFVVEDLLARLGLTLEPRHREFLEQLLASYQSFAAEPAAGPEARAGAGRRPPAGR